MALGGLAAMAAYIVNAATHNVMDSVPLLWIMGGFSCAMVKLAEKPKPVVPAPELVLALAVNTLPILRHPGPEQRYLLYY